MKITRLKLKNFIGIQHGLERDEIEIDFTKGENTIVMFLGANGSGKSTIVGSLTPFKQSTDNRTNLIIPGKEGLKEIDIEHDGHKYCIKHIYALKAPQSFISKDGKELNESGGVKSCEDIITKELGITREYSKIGKIGSNTKNFVDLQAAERKEFISTFLDTEELAEAYKIVKEKKKVLEASIATISKNLEKFQDEAVVAENLKNLKATIAQLEKDQAERIEKIGKLTEANKNASEIISNNSSIEDLEKYINEKETAISEEEAKIAAIIDLIDIKVARETRDALQAEINKITSDIQIIETELKGCETVLAEYKSSKLNRETELAGLKNTDKIVEQKEKLEKLQKDLETSKETIRANPVSNCLASADNRKDFWPYLEKFKNFTNFLEKFYKDLSDNQLIKTQKNIEYFMLPDCDERLERQTSFSRTTIEKKQELEKSQQGELNFLLSKQTLRESLDKRPSECKINTCPFIAEALKWIDLDKKITEKEEELKQTKKDIEVLTVEADNLQELKTLQASFKESYQQASPRDNFILAEFLKDKSLSQWLDLSLADFQKERQDFISNMENAMTELSNYAEIRKSITSIESTMTAIDTSELENTYNKAIEELNGKIEKVEKDIADKKEEKGKKDALLVEKTTEFNNYDTYVSSTMQITSHKQGIKNNQKILDMVKEAVQTKTENDATLTTLEAEKKNTETLLTNARLAQNKEYSNSVQIKELLNSKKKLESNYEPILAVNEALHPQKGIQLILIQTYLNEIEKIANELLATAYNGDFEIKFSSSAKEFAIKVKDSKGNIKDDINLASQGEIALTTISISLALIEQAVGEYNILALDEIDGPLDAANRENFINILEKQIKKLGIEQVFVISHNNAFDSCPMDLVLLKDHGVDLNNSTFMSNKKIIFNKDELK